MKALGHAEQGRLQAARQAVRAIGLFLSERGNDEPARDLFLLGDLVCGHRRHCRGREEAFQCFLPKDAFLS